MKQYRAKFATPFAVMGILSDEDGLYGIDFLPLDTPTSEPQDLVAEMVCKQLGMYLNNPDYRFDLPLHLHGTPHRLKVWQGLMNIPCGSVLNYGDLAKMLHSSPRAVGQACGANPIPVIIPCHRVLAKSGLGGFMNHSSGAPLLIKQWLLKHEGIKQ